MGFFTDIVAATKDYLNKKNIEKANKQARATALLMEMAMMNSPPTIGPYIEHPLHQLR